MGILKLCTFVNAQQNHVYFVSNGAMLKISNLILVLMLSGLENDFIYSPKFFPHLYKISDFQHVLMQIQ